MIAFLFTVPLFVWAFFQPLPATITYLILVGLLSAFVLATRNAFKINISNPTPEVNAIQRYSLFLTQPTACRELKRSFVVIRVATALLFCWLLYHESWVLIGLTVLAHLFAGYFEAVVNPVPYLAQRARRGDQRCAFDHDQVCKAVQRITAGEVYGEVVRSTNHARSMFPSWEAMQTPEFEAWAKQEEKRFKQRVWERKQQVERKKMQQSKRVLVASDKSELVRHVQHELEQAACQVDTATNTDEALGLIVERRYTAVVCTWSTLGINAGRIADTLRNMQSDTRIVVLADEHLRHEPSFNTIEAADFLFTPLRHGQVADAVTKAAA